MAQVYTTVQGQTVDMVCRKVYGDESGYVEAVLAANPGLASKGIVLPILTKIFLPDLEITPEADQLVTLWD